MSTQEIVIVVGLTRAGCGHLLVHEVRGAATVWAWLDGCFPAAWRSAPPLAGMTLLLLGTFGVLVPVFG